jgi:hypothetical protein
MCVHTYTDTQIHTHTCTYTDTHIHMYIYIYIHIYIHTYKREASFQVIDYVCHTHTDTHTHTHIHVYIRIHIQTGSGLSIESLHTCLHTYTQTYLHARTYTYKQAAGPYDNYTVEKCFQICRIRYVAVVLCRYAREKVLFVDVCLYHLYVYVWGMYICV